jgi:hypothetical protein
MSEDDGVSYSSGPDHEIPIIYGKDVLTWLDESGATNAPTLTPARQVTGAGG